ncbi:MAG: Omp28 family outer membrane lipoprotein [Bacteroidales bacterium]
MKSRYLLLLLVTVAFILNSCDKVEPPYVKPIIVGETDKKVLLEDYTGHECVNCPGAAIKARELQTLFNHKVIIMSVHAGFFARPSTSNPLFVNDFRTEEGDAWDTYFGNGAQGNPNGLVDRIQVNNDYVIFPESWATNIATQLEQAAKAKITLLNTFDENTNKLTSQITTKFLEQVEGNIHLLVCLTQDSIIAPQRNNTPEAGDVPINENYVHMHMLRKAMNGSWGESINGGTTISKNDKFTKEYKLDFVDEWVPKNCHIVAFIYFEDTKEVIQVEEASVIKE